MEKVKVVFLDRDGTLNIEKNYLRESSSLELIPGTTEALQKLKSAGFKIVVVTNQSGVGRGLIDPQQVYQANERLRALIRGEGDQEIIDEILICMHNPDEGCGCRKPKTGLIEVLREKWNFDLKQCWAIGDKYTDLLLGLNIGITPQHCLMVQTGYGKEEWKKVELEWCEQELPIKVNDIVSAVELVLTNLRKE